VDVVMTAVPQASRAPAAQEGPGLTYEQELFRTKWGWAAFEQVQRAAHDQAAASTP
jgi:hypothetical protein